MTQTTKYASVLARIGAERSLLISEAKMRTLTESKNLTELADQLRETVHGENVAKITQPLSSRKLERVFQENLIDAYAKIVKNAPKVVRRFLRMRLMAFEYENVKTLAKAIAAKLTVEEKIARIHLSVEEHLKNRTLLEEASKASDLKTLLDLMKKTEHSSALTLGFKKYEENGTTQLFDVLLDKAYYEYVWWTFCLLPKKEKPHATLYASITCDGYVISTLLRGKALGYDADWLRMTTPHIYLNLPKATADAIIDAPNFESALKTAAASTYGRYFLKAETPEETVANAEKAFRKALLSHAHENRISETFNIGAPLAYMTQKETETRNLTAISVGVENRWKPENIQKSLLLLT